MSQLGKTIIQKLSALNLAWIAVFVQIGFWSGLKSIDNWPARVLLHYWIGKIDPFETLTACLFLGFAVLWIVVLIQGVARRSVMITLLVILAFAGAFTFTIIPHGTVKGWYIMGYINTFTFAVNVLFAIIYTIAGKVNKN